MWLNTDVNCHLNNLSFFGRDVVVTSDFIMGRTMVAILLDNGLSLIIFLFHTCSLVVFFSLNLRERFELSRCGRMISI